MARPAVRPALSDAAVVTSATLRAATLLGLSHKLLARIVGLSEASVSRMSTGTYQLVPGEKPYELAVLFIRLYRALDGLVDGDDAVAHAWLRNSNTVLGDAPLALIQTVPGLVNTLAYLDARRALA